MARSIYINKEEEQAIVVAYNTISDIISSMKEEDDETVQEGYEPSEQQVLYRKTMLETQESLKKIFFKIKSK